MLDEHAREKEHGEALAGPLGMPDHTTSAITTDACRRERGQQGFMGGMELMIGGDLLAELAAIVFKGDEVPQQVQKAAGFKDTVNQKAQRVIPPVHEFLPVDGLPGQEAFVGGTQAAHGGLEAIADGQHGVVGHEVGNIRLIGLQLVPCLLHRGVGVRHVFEFKEAQGNAVHENHQVGPAVDAVVNDGVLVHHQKIVLFGVFIIEQADDDAAFLAVHLMRHPHAFHQHALDEVILSHQATVGGIPHHAQGFVADVLGDGGIELVDGSAQAFQQQGLAVVLAFFLIAVRADVGAEGVGVAQFLEEGDGVVFDGGFVEGLQLVCSFSVVDGKFKNSPG